MRVWALLAGMTSILLPVSSSAATYFHIQANVAYVQPGAKDTDPSYKHGLEFQANLTSDQTSPFALTADDLGFYLYTFTSGQVAFTLIFDSAALDTSDISHPVEGGSFIEIDPIVPFPYVTFLSNSAYASVTPTGPLGVSEMPSGLGVPEPATWAMMLLGFGMMGAGLRYRRKSTKISFA